MSSLPYRGVFGDPRPPGLAGLALPPGPMPSHAGSRPLKGWRYVGVFGEELMLCAALVRVGRARQAFWAVLDRRTGRLSERTRTGRGGGEVALPPGRVIVRDRGVEVDITLEETAGTETVCPAGDAYAWTRKQGGIAAHGTVRLGDEAIAVRARAVVDDTAAYYPRHSAWRWSAGVGTSRDGRPVAWNLVAGVNDPPAGSERTVWIGGAAHEAPPVAFAADLSAVGDLRFTAEAVRARRENLVVVRSAYRQPFGRFAGRLPGGIELAAGLGVMEEHDVHW
jgi:Domain of unknown function (DUF2804), C-terminal